MEGIVLDFNQTEGVIRDHDGRRYTFAMTEWQSAEIPERGAVVDFVVDGERARQIYMLARPSQPQPDEPHRPAAHAAAVTPAVYPPTRPTSTLAVVSLVMGILGLFFFGSIIAVICGHLARSEIRRSEGKLDGDGVAVAGLVLGYLGLAFTLLIVLIIMLAIGGGILASL